MSDYKTLGKALRIFNLHTKEREKDSRDAIKWYIERADYYNTMADGTLEDEQEMTYEEYRIACEQYVMLRSMYRHNCIIYVRLTDVMMNIADARDQLEYVLIAIKELR